MISILSKYVKYTFCTLISFILTSSFHLLIIAIFSKQDLGLWMDNVYFGVFGSGEDHRDKINTVTYFNQPFHYYFFVLIRDLFNYLPLALSIVFFGKALILKILKTTLQLVVLAQSHAYFYYQKLIQKTLYTSYQFIFP